MSASAGTESARAAVIFVLHLAIFLIFGTASAEDLNNTERRLIIRYSSGFRRAAHGHNQSLLSQGVSMQDLADDLAVLSGPANTVIAEALKLPGVQSIEEDIILKAHVN